MLIPFTRRTCGTKQEYCLHIHPICPSVCHRLMQNIFHFLSQTFAEHFSFLAILGVLPNNNSSQLAEGQERPTLHTTWPGAQQNFPKLKPHTSVSMNHPKQYSHPSQPAPRARCNFVSVLFSLCIVHTIFYSLPASVACTANVMA